MKNWIDISTFVKVDTIESITCNLVNRFKQRRKELKLSQKELAKRTDVSYGSIKRFEQKVDISLSSLIKLANTLGTLNEFNDLFNNPLVTSLKDL